MRYHVFFFFQAEDGIRDVAVTGVQTCALPICIWENCALIAALIYGSCTTPTSTTMIASATNGARKRGFSRTRSNTAVGSNNTRTRSRTAPIAPSRTQGSPSRTAGTAPNIREKQILRACGAQDDKRGHPERARGKRAQRRIVAALPSRPKGDGKLDQQPNGTSVDASRAEACVQHEIPRRLIEPGVRALDHPDRSRLGAPGRVDDGAHQHAPLNPGLAQQV